jgi:hypothetical protein
MILYKLTFMSGKSYIGQTQRTVKVRMQQHQRSVNSDSQLAVHCAWRVHGAPTLEILGEFEDAADLHNAEIAAITTYGTISPNGYNIGYGGETAPSKNPEVAAKIAAKARGRKQHSDELKEGWREVMADRMADPVYREKMRLANLAYWTPERKAKRAEEARSRASGVVFTEERKRKIGLANSNPTPKTREKMSAAAKKRGKNHNFSEEARAKISAHVAASWADPIVHAKRSEAIRAAFARKKQSKLEAGQ